MKVKKSTTLRVANAQQLIAQLAVSLPQDQFIRELTENGIDAVVATGKPGTVRWDYCTKTASGIPKLRIWDTGTGMDSDDLDRVNQLAAQNRTGVNFGLGAKLSLYRSSPLGAVYYTMRDGKALTARIGMHAGAWGYVPFADGSVMREMTAKEIATLLPPEIVKAGHGTAVVLLGSTLLEPTVTSLASKEGAGGRWLVPALADRYMTIPKGVTLEVVSYKYKSDGTDEFRTVPGAKHYLHEYSKGAKAGKARSGKTYKGDGTCGKFQFIHSNIPMTVSWWLLDSKADASTITSVGGKLRVVYDGEAYVSKPTLLTRAGVWTNTKRVEIHLEVNDGLATPNAQRTALTVHGEELPLDDICVALKHHLPKPITAMLETVKAAKGSGATSFKSKFATYMNHEHQVHVLSNRRTGKTAGTMTRQIVGIAPSTPSSTGTISSPGSSAPGTAAAPAARTTRTKAYKVTGKGALNVRPGIAEPVAPDVIIWEDQPDEQLRKYIARWDAADLRLIVNATHRTYTDEVKHWKAQFKGTPGADARIEASVRSVFERVLAETVFGANTKFYNDKDMIDEMTSPSHLTAAVLQLIALRGTVARSVKGTFGESDLGYGDQLADEAGYDVVDEAEDSSDLTLEIA